MVPAFDGPEVFGGRIPRDAHLLKKIGGNIIFRPTPAGGLNTGMRGDFGGLIKLVKESPSTKESPGTKARERSKFEMVAGAGNQRYLHLNFARL